MRSFLRPTLTLFCSRRMSGSDTEFSSNAHSNAPAVVQAAKPRAASSEYEDPTRHPDLSFLDGNLVILTGHRYFVVHQAVLARHSPVLQEMLDYLPKTCSRLLENRPVLDLPHTPDEMCLFLRTLYG